MKSAGLRRFRVACWLIALLCAPLANAQEKGARAADDRSPPPSTEPKAPETNPSSGPDEQRPSESAPSANASNEGAAAGTAPSPGPASPDNASPATPPLAASAAPSAVAPAATPPGQPHNASADVPAEGPANTQLMPAEPAAIEAEQAAASAGVESTSMSVGAVDVVVTGKRSRTLDLPGSVDVIGEDQISKEVATNALDLMRRIPGFAYQDYGNGGVPNGFMLRGFSSNHGNDTLVVIDGVPINEHGWYGQDDGAPDMNQLTAEEIERIEVIKGPLDARYGNWGRSGIVLINTRQRGDFWRANLSRGNYNTQKFYASFGTEHFDGKFSQVYSVESFDTDGWRENSAQQRQNAYGKWFYRPSKDVRLGLFTHFYHASWSTGSYIDEAQWQRDPQKAFSGAANDGGYKRLAEVALHADTKLLGRYPLKAILWHRQRTGSRYADWTYEGNGQTESYAFERVTGGIVSMDSDWQLTRDHSLHLDGGIDYRHFDTHGQSWVTRIRAREVLNSDDRYIFENGGLYLKAGVDLAKRVTVSGGVREDLFWGTASDRLQHVKTDMKTYSVPTYKGGVVGKVLESLSLYGNIGTTYRLPNTDTKYLRPAPPVANLLFWEAGLKANAFDKLTLRYAFFMSTERLTRLEQGAYVDDGKGRRAGHEIELKFDPTRSVSVFTAMTIHHGKYVGGTNDGNHVATVPRYIWKVGVQAEAPWGTGGRVNYSDVGKWNTDPANTHSYAGYRVVDASLYQILGRDWSIALDAKNLFNAKYCEFVGFWSGSNQYMPSNPLTIFASLRYSRD